MPRFLYQAINESGNKVTGTLDADSPDIATGILGERGFIPTRITREAEKSGSFEWSSLKDTLTKVKPRDLILFTKQFRTMVRAGVPILTLLQVLQSQTENPKLKRITGEMSISVREGSTLYEAFSKHPKVFSPLYCSMIRAGESSGVLAEVMDRLIYIIEHETQIKADIKAALNYPIMVVVFLGVAFFVLLTFAIPRFAKIFARGGIELPFPTRVCIALHHFLINYWYIILAALIAVIIFLVWYLRTEQGQYVKDRILLRMPLFGPLFVKSAMSRFASIFAILYESGIQVLDSIDILTGTIGNTAIAREFDKIKDRVQEGRGISAPLRHAKFFPPMVVNMVALGEGSGKLDETLNEISKHYDDEVAYAVKGLTDAIGPLLTIGLAAIVGFFALAIFIPMWDLTKLVVSK
ncbi:type II secretion system F family protein [Thermodesulfobacteriota bacterium]